MLFSETRMLPYIICTTPHDQLFSVYNYISCMFMLFGQAKKVMNDTGFLQSLKEYDKDDAFWPMLQVLWSTSFWSMVKRGAIL